MNFDGDMHAGIGGVASALISGMMADATRIRGERADEIARRRQLRVQAERACTTASREVLAQTVIQLRAMLAAKTVELASLTDEVGDTLTLLKQERDRTAKLTAEKAKLQALVLEAS